MKRIIIFYDGFCVLCNSWVKLLCLLDKNDFFRFSPLSSDEAKNMKELFPNVKKIDSIIVWDKSSKPKTEAEAFFLIIRNLSWYLKVLLLFEYLPISISNKIYRFIARNRYKWFGKHSECPLPDEDFNHKFL